MSLYCHGRRYAFPFFGFTTGSDLSIWRKSFFIPATNFRVGIRCNGDFSAYEVLS